MRFSLIHRFAQHHHGGGVMNTVSRPSKTALGKKYNYGLRVDTKLDDLHGYGAWVLKNKMIDVWPLVVSMIAAACMGSYILWWTLQKTEVQLNRWTEHKPWDWERAQHVFGKRHKALKDDSGMWQRIPELDQLQAEMLEVKKERLAAEKAARKAQKH